MAVAGVKVRGEPGSLGLQVSLIPIHPDKPLPQPQPSLNAFIMLVQQPQPPPFSINLSSSPNRHSFRPHPLTLGMANGFGGCLSIISQVQVLIAINVRVPSGTSIHDGPDDSAAW